MRKQFRLDAVRLRLGHVEDEARRAGAGRHGRLQILNIHIEGGHVERQPAIQKAELPPDFVVLAGLILPFTLAAELDQVLRRAQIGIDGVVDAAEAEALRHLGV